TTASTTRSGSRSSLRSSAAESPIPGVSVRRRASAFLYRHPRVRLLLLLAPPAGWIGVVYLAALAILLVSAFWRLDPLSFSVVHRLGLTNFQILWRESVYRKIAVRTVGISAGVTITDVLLAFQIGRASGRERAESVVVA